jgi:ABC-type nitrate/sulfonate/bicarbonate transport system permease component
VKTGRWLYYLGSIAVLLLLWTLTSLILGLIIPGPKARALPNPILAFTALYNSWSALGEHFLVSGLRVILGLLLAIAVAAPLGLVIGREEALNRIFAPIIYITYPIPKIVFLPLLFVLFGLGNLPVILIIALIVTFQTLLVARDAARNVPHDYILSVRSAGANRWQLYRHVIIPASLPAVLTSARISIGISIAALYLAEIAGVSSGLGYFLHISRVRFRYDDMFAGIMVMGFLGFLLYLVIDLLERALCRWKYL